MVQFIWWLMQVDTWLLLTNCWTVQTRSDRGEGDTTIDIMSWVMIACELSFYTVCFTMNLSPPPPTEDSFWGDQSGEMAFHIVWRNV